jgi:Tfp pilus assembly protein PilF
MNTSNKNKRNTGIYILLILMILALLGFSAYPYLETFFQPKQANVAPTPANTASPEAQNVVLPSQEQEKLAQEEQGYELFLQKEPDNQTALRSLLEVRLQQGDIQGAVEPLEKLARLNPQQTDYQILLAQTKQHLNDNDAAVRIYRSILDREPGNIKALNGIVNLLIAQNRPESAIGLLQDTLKLANTPNSDEAKQIDATSIQLILGQLYVQQERYTEAIAVYDQAIKNNKEDFRPVLAKAFVFQRQGKNAEAQPLFTTAMSLAPAKYKDQIKKMAIAPSVPQGTENQTTTPTTPTENQTTTPKTTTDQAPSQPMIPQP